MAVPATDTYDQTVQEIIDDAVADCTGSIGKTITGKQFTHAKRALNRLVKALDASGEFTWRFRRGRTISLVAGTATYNLDADLLDLDEPCMFGRTGQNTKTVVKAMSRDDYVQLSDRTTQGTPNMYLFERTLTGTTVTLWPVPDTSGDTLEYTAVLRAKDASNGLDTLDFPSKWQDCLRLGLVVKIAGAYRMPPDRVQMFEAQFERAKAQLISDDTERGNVILVPGYVGGGTE